MTGRIRYLREKGRGSAEIEYFYGLTILSVSLYEPEGLSARRLERQLGRLRHTFQKAGVSRIVLPDAFPHAEKLTPLQPVSCLSLYRGLADLLALGWLEARGLPPQQSCVALAAPRLCPELTETARRLCSVVQGVRIDVPGADGALFAGRLQRELGMPVVPGTAMADVRVSFGPDTEADLCLWGTDPCLAGLTLSAEGVELPEEIRQPVLALLWERGSVRRDAFHVGIKR